MAPTPTQKYHGRGAMRSTVIWLEFQLQLDPASQRGNCTWGVAAGAAGRTAGAADRAGGEAGRAAAEAAGARCALFSAAQPPRSTKLRSKIRNHLMETSYFSVVLVVENSKGYNLF